MRLNISLLSIKEYNVSGTADIVMFSRIYIFKNNITEVSTKTALVLDKVHV